MESVYKSYFYSLPKPDTQCWIKTTHKGVPVRVAFLYRYPRRIQKRLIPLKRLLQVNAVNEDNINKWYDAATRERPESSKLSSVHELIARGTKKMRFDLNLPNFATSPQTCKSALELYYLKTAAKGQLDDLHVNRCNLAMLSDIQQVASTHLRDNPYILGALKPLDTRGGIWTMMQNLLNSASPIRDHAMCMAYERHPEAVGKIFASSEPGVKLRIFASPRLLYQASLTPLFEKIWEYLAAVPTDCTHRQEAGAQWALEQLSKGKTVYSVDLSNATDAFPYAFQRSVLKDLGASHSLIEILDFVAQGKWCLPHDWNKGTYVSWTVGQPLGLLPSFGAFALTHNALLYGICGKLKRKPEDTFRILGDDIVIVDADVNRLYRQCLKAIGVKISESKTFESDHYAEFAGFNIALTNWSGNGIEPGMVRPGKYRPLTPKNLEVKLKDPDFEYPALLLPKYSHKALRRFLESPYPFGIQDLTDSLLHTQDTDFIESAFAKIVTPLRNGRVDIHSLLWKVAHKEFFPILVRQSHDLQLTCTRFLETTGSGIKDAVITDELHYEAANKLPAWEWQLYDRYARTIWEILNRHDLSLSYWVREEPLIQKGLGFAEPRSKVQLIKALISTYPLADLPCQGQDWMVLRRINRFVNGNEVSLTPVSVTRNWRGL
jgi:hypothetical protein